LTALVLLTILVVWLFFTNLDCGQIHQILFPIKFEVFFGKNNMRVDSDLWILLKIIVFWTQIFLQTGTQIIKIPGSINILLEVIHSLYDFLYF